MGKRLEILVAGTYHMVGALVLTPRLVKSGIEGYGKNKWELLVRDIALGVASPKALTQARQVVGDKLKPVFQMDGISMRGTGFGLEVFLGGEFEEVEMVDAALDTPEPEGYMKSFKQGDMLAVHYARREGALTFRWDEVKDFRPGGVCLHHVNGRAMLGGKAQLQMAVDITYMGESGHRKVADAVGGLTGYGHVLHKANAR